MKKIIFLLVLLFPTLAFGQSFTGSYLARFISLDKNVNPVAEFEVQSDGTVVGKIIISQTTTNIKGQVDSLGNLEAASIDGLTGYTLKANLNQAGGKITLTGRFEINTAGTRNNSQSYMQGNFSRVERTTSPGTLTEANQSELVVDQPNPLFPEKIFTAPEIRVVIENKDSFRLYHFAMMGGIGETERGLYFTIACPQDSLQKIWQVENIRFLNYIEKSENYTKINRFKINYEMWLKNRNIASGEIELVSENGRQMVFKIKDLKIKNEANDDMVTLNGIVYARIAKY
jgi:hypothetical protein